MACANLTAAYLHRRTLRELVRRLLDCKPLDIEMAAQTDLIDQIEWRALECLNANPEHTVNNALKQVRRSATHDTQQRLFPSSKLHHRVRQLQRVAAQGYREDDGLYLESDTDEQLLLHIPFQTGQL